MKRPLIILGYGLGGILVALVLSWGAFALAGREIGEPATPVQPAFSLSASPTPFEDPSGSSIETHAPEPNETPTSTSSPSHDGSGSGGGSGSGSDDHPSGGHPGGEDD
jgi:hypothetical protein